MHEELFPYNLPIFRRSHRASSPDGKLEAAVQRATEVAMSAPTRGALHVSNGIVVEQCNPSFVWSDDSRYVAVPQWEYRLGWFRGQRLLILDMATNQLFRSRCYRSYLQPESFASGRLEVTVNPHFRNAKPPCILVFGIPEALTEFRASMASKLAK